MATRLLACLLLPALLLGAPAKKQPAGTARGENEDLILSVTLYSDPTDVKELIGDDLGGHYIVADIKMQPKYGKTINIDRDSFLLVSDRNGERTTPFAASQIAGSEALVVTRTGVSQRRTGIGIGGLGGMTGSGGGDDASQTTVKAQHGSGEKDSPLLATLKEKILVEKKTAEPAAGLLFFPMEKQRLKDLEIRYGPQDGRITLRFKEMDSKK